MLVVVHLVVHLVLVVVVGSVFVAKAVDMYISAAVVVAAHSIQFDREGSIA